MSQLRDQVVVITGCSTGIGRALAEEFSRCGHRTFATARRIEALAGLTDCDHLTLDVTDQQSISAAISQVIARAGRIDILVNNAGVNLFGPLLEVPIEGVQRLLETNVVGLITATQAVFPHMAKQRSGRIVNVGSVVGEFPTPFAGAYCASKSAVHMLSDILRIEVAPLGIDVVVVQPGGVRSQIAASGSVGIERFAEESSHYHKVYENIQQRVAMSQDNPMEADKFARTVVAAATRRTAPRVIRAGSGATMLNLAGNLPKPLLDRILTRRFGLAALRE